jgi:hypothetical protein
MPITAAVIGGGASLLGGLLGGSSAKRAAQIQSDAQRESARLAAEEARFRPVGVTTRFGSSQFTTGPDGRVSGAGYTLSPELRAYQDRFMSLASQGLTQAEQAQQQFAPLQGAAQGLFGLGQQYLTQPADQRLGGIASQYLGAQPEAQALTSLGQQYIAQSPEQAAQQYMAKQQDLLAPSRERQMAQLQNQLFQTGRGGLSVGATGARPSGAGGLGATTPEMEAYYNALAQQDAGLAAQAMQAGQQQTEFGAGLLGKGQALEQARYGFGADLLGRQLGMEQQRASFGAGLFGTGGNLLNQGYQGQVAALSPYQAYLQGATGLESLGQQTLDIGAGIGSKSANPAGGQALLQGGMAAAGSMASANAYNPFATALTGFSQNPALVRGVRNAFSPSYNYGAFGGGSGTFGEGEY